MNYLLIEYLNTNYKLPNDFVYVALTQEAIINLDQRKINYITFEDFYTSGEIRGDTDKLLIEQLKWFDEFDELLKNVFPDAKKLNLNLASIYYYWLKWMIDNVILTCRIIKKFIDSTNPTKITFLSLRYKSDKRKHWSHTLHFQGVESTYSRLIEPLCIDYGISFERLFIDDYYAENVKEKTDFNRRVKNRFPLIFNLYNKLKQLKKTLRFLIKSYLSFYSIKTRMLVLIPHDYIYEFSKALINKPVKYYVFNKDIILHIKGFFLKKSLITNSIDNTNSIDINYDIYNENINNIYDWINNKCELNISKVIHSRIDEFIKIICPNIIYLVPIFSKYYEKEKIDYVVTSHIFTIEEHAAIAAATINENTKSIYIHHGADAMKGKSKHFKLVRYFDYFFTLTKGEAENENEIKNEFLKSSPIIHSVDYMSNRFKNIKSH